MELNKDLESLLKKYYVKKKIPLIKYFANENLNFKHPILIECKSTLIQNYFIKFILNDFFDLEDNFDCKINEHYLLNKSTFNTKTTKIHIELSPGSYGINDKNIINEYLYDISSEKNIYTNNWKNFVIWNIDDISIIGQESLKNIFDLNTNANYICTCSDINNITDSLLSLFSKFYIPIPDRSFFKKIYNLFYSDFNEIKYYSFLEQSKLYFDNYDLSLFIHYLNFDTKFDFIDNSFYEIKFHTHLKKFYTQLKLIKKFNETNIKFIRNNLYEYYVNHIKPKYFFRSFLYLVIQDDTISDDLKERISETVINYNFNAINGNKEVIHYEAFIINFMYNYNNLFFTK